GNIPRQTAQNGGNNWRLESQVERPNAYMIRSGAVIPATLISGINSDLPGMVQAQISQNVYDTATGRHLLLPQG
ncbi:TrbI/VirB10 family protein, partial [Neisseria gonorrhoeae]